MMSILNKLNGWQRFYLLAVVFLQAVWMVQSWEARWYGFTWEFERPYWIVLNEMLVDYAKEFFTNTIIMVGLLYIILHVLAVTVRWALKGFKK
jgi:hypothetical protein